MHDDRQTAKPSKTTARERREARLAEALRANLRRRKAAKSAPENAPEAGKGRPKSSEPRQP